MVRADYYGLLWDCVFIWSRADVTALRWNVKQFLSWRQQGYHFRVWPQMTPSWSLFLWPSPPFLLSSCRWLFGPSKHAAPAPRLFCSVNTFQWSWLSQYKWCSPASWSAQWHSTPVCVCVCVFSYFALFCVHPCIQRYFSRFTAATQERGADVCLWPLSVFSLMPPSAPSALRHSAMGEISTLFCGPLTEGVYWRGFILTRASVVSRSTSAISLLLLVWLSHPLSPQTFTVKW